MSLDISSVGYTTKPYEFKYDWKTVVLYALGIGAKREELDYIYEAKGPKVFPTFAVCPAYPALGDALFKTQGNLAMVVHGGQSVRLHRPIPPEGTLVTTANITGIYDMKKMAAVVIETKSTVNSEPCFDTEWSILFRGAGGFDGAPPPKADTPVIPDGAKPIWSHEEPTLPEQAALYRLSGDLNPLHIDPDFANMVGFPQGPILHGLCSYGFACRALVKNSCGGDAARMKSFSVQFRKPVWPGEVVRTDAYELGGGKVAVRVFAGGRDEAVINNAWAEIGGA